MGSASMSKISNVCLKITKRAFLVLIISVVLLATATLALVPSSTTGNNKLSPPFSYSNYHHPAAFTSKRKRGDSLLYSSTDSASSQSTQPPTKAPKSTNKNATRKQKTKRSNNNDAAALSPSSAIETYTNHWDNLLLEEHQLALEEWRDRRRKSSLKALERQGLAISRAFALPDSEILGEKTVRIHNGSGGSSGSQKNNFRQILNDENENVISNDNSRARKPRNSYGGGRFRRPWSDSFSKGDILEMTAAEGVGGFGDASTSSLRKECLVMDVGDTWMLVGVGKTWPLGIWDSRKGLRKSIIGRKSDDQSYGYPVRLDKTPNAAAVIPLKAQRSALQTIREQQQQSYLQNQNKNIGPMRIATWLAKTNDCKGYYQIRNKQKWAKNTPAHFLNMVRDLQQMKNDEYEEERSLESYLHDAIERVTQRRSLQQQTKNWSATANESQREAVAWALSRRVSSIQGPPGTGKTRVAALLIATALEMASGAKTATHNPPFKVLAVAHSNGAADVLLEALLELGVPAIRAGRPAAISTRVRHRSALALAEKIPQVVRLRQELLEANDINKSNNIEWELQQCLEDAQDALLDSAPVVVTSCIGAHQLSVRHDKLREEEQNPVSRLQDALSSEMNDDSDHPRFNLVVLDEAAQCTEPALLCALVAARAEQLVMLGDTRQLPPTVASSSEALRKSLGISPMERLEKSGLVEQTTLRIQYRMVEALLEHPSKYFYNGLVKSAVVEQHVEMEKMETLSKTSLSGVFDAATATELPPTGFAWPNPSLPLAFVRVGKGDSEILHDSSLGLAGRSNPSEAALVAEIVADILEEGELRSSQICVLTPYSKQVSAIRSTLEKESLMRKHRNINVDRNIQESFSSKSQLGSTSLMRSMSNVRVGTIDSFQGQETEVVVFSAVRSNSFSELGFLRDQRRLCVALTRARKGLIILGDSSVLKSCRHWRSLIESCQNRKCFITEEDLANTTHQVSDSICNDVDSNMGEDIKNAAKREELSQLKSDEEFLGLFTPSTTNSKESL